MATDHLREVQLAALRRELAMAEAALDVEHARAREDRRPLRPQVRAHRDAVRARLRALVDG